MRRAGFSTERELERIYDNMLPEYQLFTRRQDFRTLTKLTHLVVNFEGVSSRRSSGQTEYRVPTQRQTAGTSYGGNPGRMPDAPAPTLRSMPPNTQSRNPTATQVDDEPIVLRRACLNCSLTGHFTAECRNPRQLFCWDCGRRGVRTLDCCRRSTSGNGHGPRVTGNHPKDPPHSQQQ